MFLDVFGAAKLTSSPIYDDQTLVKYVNNNFKQIAALWDFCSIKQHNHNP